MIGPLLLSVTLVSVSLLNSDTVIGGRASPIALQYRDQFRHAIKHRGVGSHFRPHIRAHAPSRPMAQKDLGNHIRYRRNREMAR